MINRTSLPWLDPLQSCHGRDIFFELVQQERHHHAVYVSRRGGQGWVDVGVGVYPEQGEVGVGLGVPKDCTDRHAVVTTNVEAGLARRHHSFNSFRYLGKIALHVYYIYESTQYEHNYGPSTL